MIFTLPNIPIFSSFTVLYSLCIATKSYMVYFGSTNGVSDETKLSAGSVIFSIIPLEFVNPLKKIIVLFPIFFVIIISVFSSGMAL